MSESRRVSVIEAFALGLASALPVLPYLVRLIRMAPARFVVEGDYAALELATRFAFSGRTLLGPYSRFGFNHPGPSFFFLAAPVHALFGDSSRGLFAGACVINLLSAFAIGFSTRLLGTRTHGVAAALATIAWIAAFGNATPLPWNPLVVALPLFAFLVLACLFGAGRAAAAPFAVAFGMLVMQTHVSTVPTVGVVSVAALAAYLLRHRRAMRTRDRRFLLAAVGVFVLQLLPMLIEQVTASDAEGNLTKLARFFANRPEPLKSMATAWNAFMSGTAWLPDRLFHSRVLDELYPHAMASEPVETMSAGSSPLPAIVMFAAVLAALVVARKRRDEISFALSAGGLVASLSAILAMRGVVGITFQYLVFWTTAASTLAWLGVVSTFASASGRWGWRAASVAVLIGAIFATSLSARWNEKWTAASDKPRADMQTLYVALRAELEKRHSVPVVHIEGAWYVGTMLANELTRDGIDVRGEARERWLLGRQLRTPTGVTGNMLHVWGHTASVPIKFRECTELVTTSEGIELRVSPNDVRECP